MIVVMCACTALTAGPDDLPPMMNQGNYGGSYDDRPAVSKASMAEGGTPSRFREVDPSAQGGNNDEVPAGATGRGQYPAGEEDGQPSPGGGGGGG